MKTVGKSSKKSIQIDDSIKFEAEKIIENALNLHATDAHIDPREDGVLVRFRIGGVLRKITTLPLENYANLVKYFKFLGDLDFSEKTFAQSNTISYGAARIRISTTPTFNGEKITLRLMRARKTVRPLCKTGLHGENLNLVRQALRAPRGIIFTVGDGKNTTNFSLLKEILTDEKNIVSVEKRIEKILTGMNQTEIKPKIGLDYLKTLKMALRQNPDVILVDNIPDRQTAELIFDTAMRGKLVIASLPVANASEVIPFLNYLEIEPFMISANTLAIIGQTLVRTVSKSAIKSEKITKAESQIVLREFGISAGKLHELEKKSELSAKNSTSDTAITHLPVLREDINHELAFTGTTGIFEVISLLKSSYSSELRALINIRPNSSEIEEFLCEKDFISLKIDGLLKILAQQTVLTEILRRTGF